MSTETTPGSGLTVDQILGSAVQRREDPALLTGDAQYTDDIQYPRLAHMAVVRSQHAHATITDIDTTSVADSDILGIHTYDDLIESGIDGTLHSAKSDWITDPPYPLLANNTVRYQGQPIAIVVAETRYAAAQAARDISVDYDRLDPVIDPASAQDSDSPPIHDESPDNTVFEYTEGDKDRTDDAFSNADTVISLDIENNRLIPTAMEPRVNIARYTPASNELQIESSTQKPHDVRSDFAKTLGLPEHKVSVRAPAVGGGFGSKIYRHPDEALTAWSTIQHDRPVKWQATRSEGFQATIHARDHRTSLELAVNDDLTVQGLRADAIANIGAFAVSVGPPTNFVQMLPGQYDFPAVHAKITGVFTNTTPVAAYRGAGRPEATYAIERLMSYAANELGVDPIEFRKQNFIPPDAFPYESQTGHTYDSGEYTKSLNAALNRIDYDGFRSQQAESNSDTYRGIGISCYVEACGSGPSQPESGRVHFHPSGTVTAYTGTSDPGTGLHTSFAQIIASELGIPYDDIEIVDGDTARTPEGHGTSGSRAASVAGSALIKSARKVIEQARAYAAHTLEAAPDDLEFTDGEFRIAGAPERSLHIKDIATEVYAATDLPNDVEAGLDATAFYNPSNYTFPFGTHIAIVSVTPDTGEITVDRYIAIDDVGNQINPKIVEGQIHGGITQGLGQALYEAARYDSNGNLISGSFQDYVVPKAFHAVEMETGNTVTECPHNPLGVKGVGEAGTIAAPPAIVNAVVDALRPFDIDHLDMPISEEDIWNATHDH